MPDPQSLPTNAFKRNLASGKKQLGLWLTLESVTSTEMASGAGYDWLLLDMEHTTLDASDVLQHLRAAKGGMAELVVRVPTNEPVLVKRLLDCGVRSFLFPMVNSAEDARRAVAATRYPPVGIRGVAGNNRASVFGRVPTYFKQSHEEICVIVQIESIQAVEALADIGAVDGVDGLFLGPNDLAASIGLLGQTGAPEVKKIIADALGVIQRAGKSPGVLNFIPAEAQALLAAGYQFIAIGSDTSLLVRRVEALVEEVRKLASLHPS